MIPQASKNEYNWGERTGRSPNTPGVYYHPEAKKFVETSFNTDVDGNPILRNGQPIYHQATGKIQADAFVQIGYRKATDEEIKLYRSERAKLAKTIKAVQSGKTTVV